MLYWQSPDVTMLLLTPTSFSRNLHAVGSWSLKHCIIIKKQFWCCRFLLRYVLDKLVYGMLFVILDTSLCCVFRDNMPSHFKFKEYCPIVFRNLRERFGFDDETYLVLYHNILLKFLFFIVFVEHWEIGNYSVLLNNFKTVNDRDLRVQEVS